MTSAPAGMATFAPTALIRSPSINMTALMIGASLLPSINRPQRMAILRGASGLSGCRACVMLNEDKTKRLKISAVDDAFHTHLFLSLPRKIRRPREIMIFEGISQLAATAKPLAKNGLLVPVCLLEKKFSLNFVTG